MEAHQVQTNRNKLELVIRRESEDPNRPVDFLRNGRSGLVAGFSSILGEGKEVSTGGHVSNKSSTSVSDVGIRPTVDVKLVGTRICRRGRKCEMRNKKKNNNHHHCHKVRNRVLKTEILHIFDGEKKK